jgi:hypothetical protein
MDWTDVKNACINTINKEPTNNIPSNEFKLNLLISEHSPIRLLNIRWRWTNIKSWVATHFARHWLGWDKFISTQRSDRTGVNRDELPQGSEVIYDGKANAQALINVSKVRLCNQASKETREAMEELKCSILPQEIELANVLVPSCIYRCGCPEFKECGFWKSFVKLHKNENLLDIKNRYKLYNEDFYKKKGMI